MSSPLIEFVRVLRVEHSDHVCKTWLQEFGYYAGSVHAGLAVAARERGPRLSHELSAHSKRLADRATMGAQRMTGRAEVIR